MRGQPGLSSQPDDDVSLVERIAHQDHRAFEALMRRYNGKLFRVARSILRNDSEAEDALQDAYLDAFRHISDFRAGSSLATWLTRITINHALMRLRKQRRNRVVVSMTGTEEGAERDVADETGETPAGAALRGELRRLIEQRIDGLPLSYRTVFVMRDVEEMTVEETANALGIPSSTVRTRLHRARALLRESLAQDVDDATIDVFGFAGERCDRIVGRVLERCGGAV
jgi:RNA polymerase sigma-70 factor (ECF subfamily)